jgi:hypothetical protein
MSHIVEHSRAYAVLPHSKYGLSTSPPSNIMNDSEYTLFVKVKIEKQKEDNDSCIIARPGRHSGLFFSNNNEQGGGYLKFILWAKKGDEYITKYDDVYIEENDLGKELILHTTRDSENNFKFFINGEVKSEVKIENGEELIDYRGEPYYIGAGNPFSIDPVFCNYGEFEFHFVGLVSKEISYEDILSYSSNIIKHERHGLNVLSNDFELKKHTSFYFDFENISRYRIWDVSDNGNHLNLHWNERDDLIEDKGLI